MLIFDCVENITENILEIFSEGTGLSLRPVQVSGSELSKWRMIFQAREGQWIVKGKGGQEAGDICPADVSVLHLRILWNIIRQALLQNIWQEDKGPWSNFSYFVQVLILNTEGGGRGKGCSRGGHGTDAPTIAFSGMWGISTGEAGEEL